MEIEMKNQQMKHDVPKYSELFLDALKSFAEIGRPASNSEIAEIVIRRKHLPNSITSVPHSGHGKTTELEYQLMWVRTYLKASGLLYQVKRGIWALSEKGVAASKNNSVDTKAILNAVDNPETPHQKITSKFLPLCIDILRKNSPNPLGVGEIIRSAMLDNPDLNWKTCNGAVRAALLRAAKRSEEVRMVPNVSPPLFFVANGESVVEKPVKSYSYLDCAEKVLREFGSKQPMHYRDITAKALEQEWLVPEGKNPASVLNAVVGIDIRKRQSLRKPARFVQHGKGYIGLAEWMSRGIRFQAEQHNNAIRDKLLASLHRMSPEAFENLVRALLDNMDFVDTEVTRLSGDGGIDVRGTWRIADGIQIKMAIQVKRWKANVQAPVVQAVRGALTGSERGMIITTSDFSKGAREEAEDQRRSSTISLVNGKQLVKLLEQYKVGVTSTPIEVLELDPESGLFGTDKG